MGNSRSQEIQEKEKAISDEIDKEIKLERRTLKNKMNVLLWASSFFALTLRPSLHLWPQYPIVLPSGTPVYLGDRGACAELFSRFRIWSDPPENERVAWRDGIGRFAIESMLMLLELMEDQTAGGAPVLVVSCWFSLRFGLDLATPRTSRSFCIFLLG